MWPTIELPEYEPIDTAPKDGTLVNAARTVPGSFSLFRCFWKNGKWREMNLKSEVHPTHWRKI
jgi:hypothetical protein